MKPLNKLYDKSLSIEERVSWLLSEMTIEEKLNSLSGFSGKLDRFHIPDMAIGGEAAHGVEARNDQFHTADPILTTVFTQPLGMSATWDAELIKKAGEATGKEARVVYHRTGGGLVRWAPTVDLERDPRWGRTEEGYGEDPNLTGKMASAFTKGLQGEDEKYLRVAATLKHFYGNNDEEMREFGNASIDPRNKYELYLEPFRRVITEAHAEAVMTAYNKINGVPGMENPEVKTILKKEYGLGHAVSDGMAPTLAYYRHRYGAFSQIVADAIKAGVDSMSDTNAVVGTAAREAYMAGMLTEADLDEAIGNMFRTKLKLGIFDEKGSNPFDNVTEADLNSEKHQEICREVSRESVVLLKNENNCLPLDVKDAEEIALIGQLGDAWFHDWYGGEPFYKNTLKKSLGDILGKEPAFADGCDRVYFETDGKYLVIDSDNNMKLGDEPELFIREQWGEGSNTFRSVRTGLLMNVVNYADGEEPSETGRVAAKKKEPFAWMVQSIFHIVSAGGENIIITDVFNDPVEVLENGTVRTSPDYNGTSFKMHVAENGIEKAVQFVKGKKAAIVALGCHPTVNAKETVDRKTINFPEGQMELLKAVAKANPNTIFVLYSNYPYAIGEAAKEVPAVLWNTTGSQDIGLGIAEVILGKYSPAGRLNMTWYMSDKDLPPITDYDIIGSGRTYRYFEGEVLYPFGYGLTYADFDYSDFEAEVVYDQIKVSVKVKNIGSRISDEVVQIYGIPCDSIFKKAKKQLLAFERIHRINPGEEREIQFTVPISEFFVYDTAAKKQIVESGEYTLFVGGSSVDERIRKKIWIQGEEIAVRKIQDLLEAEYYDSHDNTCLEAGMFGYTAVCVNDKLKPAVITYKRCVLNEKLRNLRLILKSEKHCEIQVFVDGKKAGEFAGNTKRPQKYMSLAHLGHAKIDMINTYYDNLEPGYNDIVIPLEGIAVNEEKRVVEIHFSGDAKLLYGLFEYGPVPEQEF